MNPPKPNPRGARTSAAIAFALATLLLASAPSTLAAPSPQEIDQAQGELSALNERLSLLVEEYDQTKLALDEAQARLAHLRDVEERALAEEARARGRLGAIAAEAYKNPAAPLEILLSSASLGELTDRLQFLDTAAQVQSDTAAAAEVAGVRADEAAEQAATIVEEESALLDELGGKQAEIEGAIGEQQTLVSQLEDELQAFRERQAALAAAAAEAREAASTPDTGPISPPPPVSGEGAAAAIAAAESVLGVPYQYAGASPETGFDCSGLTMWAWGHAGVSLPHSSAAQYSALPHVDRDQLQPGDLVFFYSPIHHVGLYTGGGMMIHAPHTGAYVERVPVYSDNYVGAARPG